jgi:uncharacterized membrane protein
MPDELLTFLAAMTPIGELRLSIPLGVGEYGLAWPLVLVLSIAGNMLPVPFLIWGLRTVGGRIERMDNVLGRLLRWRTRSVEARWGERIRRQGFPAIVLLVAIPLPFTGAWTGSLAVWALGVPAARGLMAIATGLLIAGAVVTALTLAGIELIKIL